MHDVETEIVIVRTTYRPIQSVSTRNGEVGTFAYVVDLTRPVDLHTLVQDEAGFCPSSLATIS